MKAPGKLGNLATAVLKGCRHDDKRKREIVSRAEAVLEQLMRAAARLREILGDAELVAILEEDKLSPMPERLRRRIASPSGSVLQPCGPAGCEDAQPVAQSAPAGLCPEAAEILADRPILPAVLRELEALKPARQIEAAHSMVTMNRFSLAYARSLFTATPPGQLANGRKWRGRQLSVGQRLQIQRRSTRLNERMRAVEKAYGSNGLEFVLTRGYLDRLLSNARVVRHLARHHDAALAEIQRILERAGDDGVSPIIRSSRLQY